MSDVLDDWEWAKINLRATQGEKHAAGDALAAEVTRLRSESDGRRRALLDVGEDRRQAQVALMCAEAELDEAMRNETAQAALLKTARREALMEAVDIRFEYYRAPGQGLNEGPRGCRVTLGGVSASSHDERSQGANKRAAIRALAGGKP